MLADVAAAKREKEKKKLYGDTYKVGARPVRSAGQRSEELEERDGTFEFAPEDFLRRFLPPSADGRSNTARLDVGGLEDFEEDGYREV